MYHVCDTQIPFKYRDDYIEALRMQKNDYAVVRLHSKLNVIIESLIVDKYKAIVLTLHEQNFKIVQVENNFYMTNNDRFLNVYREGLIFE